jgi:hypothetical protein
VEALGMFYSRFGDAGRQVIAADAITPAEKVFVKWRSIPATPFSHNPNNVGQQAPAIR